MYYRHYFSKEKIMKAAMTRVREKTAPGDASAMDIAILTGLATVGAGGILIGLWAIVALFAGMVASGGPLALLADYVRAVTGM